jgi:hypothetical protein
VLTAEPQAVRHFSVMELPVGLIEYHRAGGRLEGDLGDGMPGWFQLWPISEIEELNVAYEVQQNVPGYVAFGSNGGGEMLALSPAGQVVAIPFIGMEVEDAIVVADSWEAFESRLNASHA